MEVIFSIHAKNDLQYWKKTNNEIVLKRIRFLIQSIKISPFSGIGKPEPLRYNLKKTWSRRITPKDRMIYEVDKNVIIIHSLIGHYD